MRNVTVGRDIRSADFPPTQSTTDDTIIAQISSTSYIPGTPEVGVYFVAPTSGRVRMTIGGGMRDGPTGGTDRVSISPEIFQDNSSGTQILAPTIDRGYGSDESSTEFQYGSRVTMVENLSPGEVYYARVVYLASGPGTLDSADIASRDIMIIPVP